MGTKDIYKSFKYSLYSLYGVIIYDGVYVGGLEGLSTLLNIERQISKVPNNIYIARWWNI